MQLHLTDEQEMLRDGLGRLLAEESTGERARAAEPLGFDPELWKSLVDFGAPGLRVPEKAGGSGLGLFEAALAAEQAGRHLASAPFIEAMVANRLLSDFEAAAEILRRALSGEAMVSFVPRALGADEAALVPGGAVAKAAVMFRGGSLVLTGAPAAPDPVDSLGLCAPALWPADAGAQILSTGEAAGRLFQQALEEWRLLTASALCGLAERSLELAAQYANQRIQFDKPIGSFQGISHPLADAVSATDGG
jgi:alkylation response protein AidB-like acyl-CoA dehydrogenase